MTKPRFLAEKVDAPAPRAGEQLIDYSMLANDEVKTTTCYMCACRCGIKVHLKNGQIRYIEGNRDQLLGKIQERYGVAKEEAEKQVAAWQRLATDAWFGKDQRRG